MRGVAFLIGCLAVVQTVYGMCPNRCSGHGACGANDKCTCYPNFQGASCTERKCPFDKAWNSPSVGGEHEYVECSNKGFCDRATGQCTCQDGFTGEACQRMTCPNDCNGKGQCKTLADIAVSAGTTYTGWDADKMMACVCDAGYSGIDCSKRMCKLGDDPHSVYDSNGAVEVHSQQQIVLGSTTSMATLDEFVLEYVDWRGKHWFTRPILALNTEITAVAIKEALESLPQRSIPQVDVNVGTTSTTAVTFTVTFVSSETPGEQPLLVAHQVGCAVDGCQPVYTGITGATADTVEATYVSSTGTTQRIECSGRGTCDYDQGVCVCADGNRGEACEKLTLVF